MVYLVRQTENLQSDGGDTMKLVALVLKWIYKKLKKKKPIELYIQSVNSKITLVIHKD